MRTPRYTIDATGTAAGQVPCQTLRAALVAARKLQAAEPDRAVYVVEWDEAPRARRVFCRRVWPLLTVWEAR